MRTQIVLLAVFLCLLSVENLLAIQVTFRGRAACLTQDDPVIKHVGDDREPTSQTFAIVDQEFNVTGLPENEYWTHGGALGEYSWS
ncbi:MAG: hypothetical protein IJT83_01070, partial [Victivallales bacterium]|nr:hypothetical protein [Victivallales bacterium]